MKRIYRCIECQLTITVETDAKAPLRTLTWLASSVLALRCPVCVKSLAREGERAPIITATMHARRNR